MDLMGPALYAQRPCDLGHSDRQGVDEAGAGARGASRCGAGGWLKSAELFEGDPLARPYVLKPVNEGSSVGIAIVTADGNYGEPIGRDVVGPWQEFEELLAEPYVRGRELTTAVLGDRALGVTELRPKNGLVRL